MKLLQISTPHFCAGIIIRTGYCVKAPPILKWTILKTEQGLLRYFKNKGWKVVECEWREK